MKMYLIGIFDRKAQTFISLEPTPSIAVSLRQLTENVNKQSDSPIYKWPEDYSLWDLGTWDTGEGQVRARSGDAEYNEGKRHTWDGDLDYFEKKLIIECESLKAR